MHLLEFVILSALTIAGMLFVLKKWGVLSTYQVHRKNWMPPADCYFCMSFWASLLPSLLFYVHGSDESGWGWVAPLAICALSSFICAVIIQPNEV